MADFVDVPDVPGVPALPRSVDQVFGAVVSLTADALGLSGIGNQQSWGLYLDGQPVIEAENVVAFGFKKGFAVLTYPIEEGGFQSYNKVARPFNARLRFSTGGSLADRQAFLASVDDIVSSLSLCDAITPEAIYPNVNPIDYDYNRAGMRGSGLLTVDVICEEVRVTASSQFTSSTSTTGSAQTDAGTTTGTTASFNPGNVERSDLAPLISSPAIPSASPQVNGGNVQPSTVPDGSIDISAVVQP